MKLNHIIQGDPAPTVKRLIATLNALPKDEAFDSLEVSRRSGVSVHTIRSTTSGCPALAAFRHQVGRKMWWGHPEAINQLRKGRP